MYHLMTLVTAEVSGLLTMVAGYALQAVGIAIFAVLLRYRRIQPRTIYITALILYAVCLIPAVLGTTLTGTIIFGFLMSLLCGVIAGCYLFELTEYMTNDRRAVSFGIGYGVATIASWLLSLIDNGLLYYGNSVLIVCLVLTALAVLSAFIPSQSMNEPTDEVPEQEPQFHLWKLLLLSGVVVLLFSLVNNIGFSFSTPELQGGLRPEFSRLFYTVGLITAGFVTDKSRKYGAVCALASLVIPFIVLALRSEPISSTVFWALGYFAFGFYSVYRIILFSDIAKARKLIFLSGFGLMIGRVGDAAGYGIYTAFSARGAVLVVLAALLFAGSIFLFIWLFQILYVPTVTRQRSEREIFEDFSITHALSGREREVLKLLLLDKSNKEISEALYVSESTVKFHIHNLLQKTGCKSRIDLKSTYNVSQ